MKKELPISLERIVVRSDGIHVKIKSNDNERCPYCFDTFRTNEDNITGDFNAGKLGIIKNVRQHRACYNEANGIDALQKPKKYGLLTETAWVCAAGIVGLIGIVTVFDFRTPESIILASISGPTPQTKGTQGSIEDYIQSERHNEIGMVYSSPIFSKHIYSPPIFDKHRLSFCNVPKGCDERFEFDERAAEGLKEELKERTKKGRRIWASEVLEILYRRKAEAATKPELGTWKYERKPFHWLKNT
jgi:hypothetical protein